MAPARIAAVSLISTMNVDSPRARLSAAPTRVKIRSTMPTRARRAGTNEPTWASSAIWATWRRNVDLPAMLGPVTTRICGTVPVLGTLFGVHLAATAAVDYDTARLTDSARYARLFHSLLRRGVAMAPGAFEVGFVGLAHTDADLNRIVDAAGEAAAEAARTV